MDPEEIEAFIESEIGPWIERGILDDDLPSTEEWSIIGTNQRWRVELDEDSQNNLMMLNLVEYDAQGVGNIWETEHTMDELAQKMAARGIGLPNAQTPKPKGPDLQQMQARLYDLSNKGVARTPQESEEYRRLLDQYQRETGKKPGFVIAKWIRSNCRFAQ